jgi:serine/threonine-protein kinase
MGVVYRVTHLSLGTERALKLIAPEFASDEAFRERFRREWRIAASIDHPHVIPIHDAGEADGQLYIAMRFVDGIDLRQLIIRDGALDHESAAALVGQVASALDAAHARGLIHRDIKPANILIETVEGRRHAYLTDFGLSKHSASGAQLTETGHWVGTADYVAPEQIEGKAVDARTDVYALGCVAFQALTGEVPFPKDSDIAKIWAHMNDPPPSLGERVPGLPGDLDAVVGRALAKAPEDRHQSAGAFGRDLVAAAQGTAPEQPPPTKQSRAPGRRRRPRRVPALGMVLAVLTAAIVLVVLLTGGGGDGDGSVQARATLVEYQQRVGDVCTDLNRTNRETARRTRPYQRRLNRAKDLTALRDAIVAETQQRITTASALRARLVGLEPPDGGVGARQRATARAWERNVADFQSYRDRLKDVRDYDDLIGTVRRFDKRRTAVERTSADVRAGLQRLGGPACRLATPPAPKPVSLPRDPAAAARERKAEAAERQQQSEAQQTEPQQTTPPDTTPPATSSPPPDTTPPPAAPSPPDATPPSAAPSPDLNPPVSGGGEG